MSSFKGQYAYAVDQKGRTNIPAKFRKSMSRKANQTFVITQGLESCLFAYPLDEWEKIEEKLRTLSMMKKSTRLFIRMMMSNASESQFDKQGRIAIPQNLIKFAQIEKEVLIIGTLEKLEMWNPKIYEKYISEAEQTYEELAESIMSET